MENRKPTPAQRDLILQALRYVNVDPLVNRERIINTYRTPEVTTRIMQEQGWIKRERLLTDAVKIRELQDEIVRLASEARDQLNQSIDNWGAARGLLERVKFVNDQLSTEVYRVTPEGEKAVGWAPQEVVQP